MITQLKIYPKSRPLDWQRSGHYGNVMHGISQAPTTKLLPFSFLTPIGLTVAEFSAKKVKPLDRATGVGVIESISINTALLYKITGVNLQWYYLATEDINGLSLGLWQYYIKMSDDSEYMSELMYVPTANELVVSSGDFNDDFNNDFAR